MAIMWERMILKDLRMISEGFNYWKSFVLCEKLIRIETLELQTNKQFLKAIKDADREFKEGKIISFDELVEELELKNEF